MTKTATSEMVTKATVTPTPTYSAELAPDWNVYGTPTLGEYNSAHHDISMTAGRPIRTDIDGALYPILHASLWAQRGDGYPIVAIEMTEDAPHDAAMHLDEAERFALALLSLVKAGRETGAL